MLYQPDLAWPRGYLEVGARVTLILVFGVAAVSKVRGADAWRRYRAATAALVPVAAPLVTVLAVAVVVGEVAVVTASSVNVTAVPGFAAMSFGGPTGQPEHRDQSEV